MIEPLRQMLMHACLCGLCASLLAWLVVRAICILRRLPLAVRLAVFPMCIIATVVAQKTNAPPRSVAGPLVQPALSEAERMAANWNVRGAWKDSFWRDFDGGWVFPWGTNHLAGVEVVSFGQVWATPFDTNAVASAGAAFEIVPGLTTFAQERTPSNTYRFAWTDAALGRDTNALVSAALELFRNGDVSVTTNGVTTTTPRALPFPHDGYGQDAEWVTANFTNAAEILAVGYANWVDAQVGIGLTNGLYKFTASFVEPPPEATILTVGDYSVCVTNAGDYVFVLEKGAEYEFFTWPFNDDVEYSARDDMAPAAPVLRSWSGGWDAPGTWTVDGGWNWLDYPAWGYPGSCCWLPTLRGSPDILHIGPTSGTMTFTANLSDYRYAESVAYHWSCEDGNVVIATPNARTTEISFTTMPGWRAAELSVTATVGTNTLCSTLEGFTYGTNETPQVYFNFSSPEAVLLNSNKTDNAKLRKIALSLSTDAEKSGQVRLSCISGGGRIALWGASNRTARVTLPRTWDAVGFSGFEAYLEGVETSESLADVRIKAEYLPANDAPCEIVQDLTVVEVGDVSLPGAPADGLVVSVGTSVVFDLDVRPVGSDGLLSVIYYVRRLRCDGTYTDWQYATGSYCGVDAIYNPPFGGIYQVQARVGIGSGAADERFYVWEDYSDYAHGIKSPDDLKAFGVCDAEWQKTLRNCAKGYLGNTSYGRDSTVAAYGGFSQVGRDSWKCNIFVAHRLVECQLPVPAVHHGRFGTRDWPPLANEWGNHSFEIAHWPVLESTMFPQPGMIAVRPSAGPNGHMGILDFDGMAISAQRDSVTRASDVASWGTAVYRRYTDE